MNAEMREKKAMRLRQAQVNELVQILETEHLGATNATTNAALAARMGMTDRGSAGRHGLLNSSELTRIIQAARDMGYPIAADNRGIFFPKTAEEFEETIRMNDHRAATYTLIANTARRAVNIFFGGDRRSRPAAMPIPARIQAEIQQQVMEQIHG